MRARLRKSLKPCGEDIDMLDFLTRLEADMTVARPRIHGGQGYGLGRPSQTIPATANDLLLNALPARLEPSDCRRLRSAR